MNLHRKTSSVRSTFESGHNILSATGLSRAFLRGMFASSGLFGADSSLSGPEQASLYAELKLPAGTVPPFCVTTDVPNHWRLAAIRSVVRVILGGNVDGYARQIAFARQFGVSGDVLSEVTRTVRTAMLVYGVGAPVQRDVRFDIIASATPGANEHSTQRSRA
ncbi:hypothetical protein DFR24_1051 [Panacagrimonas perspica]|uniref:Uncharacterized protein n=1 Tax=Panacagrimonas perspica TaxID=381431 RepID=A0A4R7PC41_9GAMM|nr:hypothetical protein [Panacagrimonas perspica]TDU31674.1 hypothetical protein DFR24_1051 [Panacagrimonas perspica]THD03110.1 hypothetical protein B1810_10985 [Panacagrimonas perspica]